MYIRSFIHLATKYWVFRRMKTISTWLKVYSQDIARKLLSSNLLSMQISGDCLRAWAQQIQIYHVYIYIYMYSTAHGAHSTYNSNWMISQCETYTHAVHWYVFIVCSWMFCWKNSSNTHNIKIATKKDWNMIMFNPPSASSIYIH